MSDRHTLTEAEKRHLRALALDDEFFAGWADRDSLSEKQLACFERARKEFPKILPDGRAIRNHFDTCRRMIGKKPDGKNRYCPEKWTEVVKRTGLCAAHAAEIHQRERLQRYAGAASVFGEGDDE